MKYWVKTNTSVEYSFNAERFEIINDIVHFYDSEGSPLWVIKDWVSFGCEEESTKQNISPDQFYDNLMEDPDNKEII